MARYAWESFPREAREAGVAEVVLADSGWNAAIAFLAGPDHVRAMPRLLGPIEVTQVVGDDAFSWLEPATEADESGVHADMCDYVRRLGLPAPPPRTQWVLTLPPGIDAALFWATLNEAAAEPQDQIAVFSADGVEPPPSVWLALGSRLADALDRMYGGGSMDRAGRLSG